MLIDCDSCTVRGAACAGCLVTALIEAPPAVAELTTAELYAIEVLARAGLEVTVLGGEEAPARRELRSRPGRRAGWEGAA
jgi:hypothetical protein